MFKNFISSKSYPRTYVFLSLLFVAIVVRVPFINVPFLGDMATHLIISEWILNGNLPYIEYKDFKPPILYLFTTIISFLSKKNFLLVNFYTSIIVAFSSYLIFVISNNFTNSKNSFFGATIYIIYSTYLSSSGEQLPNAHLSNLFILTSFIFILKSQNKKNLFYIGFLLGMACMIRQNLIIIPLFVGFYIGITELNKSNLKDYLGKILFFIGGGFFVYLVLALPYIVTGNIEIFLKETILNPLTFVGDRGTTRYDLTQQLIRNILHIYNYTPDWLKFFHSTSFWLINLIAFTMLVIEFFFKKKDKIFNFKFIMLIVYIVSISISIFITFKPLSHYVIQLIPFCIIFILYCVGHNKFNKIIYINLLIFYLFSSINLFNSYIDYYKSEKNISNSGPYIVSNYLKSNLNDNDKIFIFQPHLVYWIINKYPIQQSVHYSDIFKDSILKNRYGPHHDRVYEFEMIMNKNPKFLVFSKNMNFNEFLKLIYSNDKDILEKIKYYKSKYTIVYETDLEDRFKFYSYGSGVYNTNYLIYKILN